MKVVVSIIALILFIFVARAVYNRLRTSEVPKVVENVLPTISPTFTPSPATPSPTATPKGTPKPSVTPSSKVETLPKTGNKDVVIFSIAGVLGAVGLILRKKKFS